MNPLEGKIDSKPVHPVHRESEAGTLDRSVVCLHPVDCEEVLTAHINLERACVEEVADLLRHLVGDFCGLQTKERCIFDEIVVRPAVRGGGGGKRREVDFLIVEPFLGSRTSSARSCPQSMNIQWCSSPD